MGPPGLLYVTNLPGATAAFTATPPFVAALSPAQQLLRRRNVRCIVSLLSPTGAVPHSAQGEIKDMEAAATACPSLRPYLGGTECPDFSASTAVATAAGRVRPYPVYIRIPIIPSPTSGNGSPAPRSAALLTITSTLHAACELVAFHEGRLLGRLEAAAVTPTPDQELMVPVYHLHAAVEDSHNTRLSSFLPILLPLLHMYMHEGGTEKDFEFALAAGERLLTQLGYPDGGGVGGGAPLNLSPLLISTGAPSPSTSSWAAKASSQPVTPYHAPAFSNPPSLPNTPSIRAAHDSTTSLPPTLASLASRPPSQRRGTDGSWAAAHTLLHQTQHRLRTLLGEVVVAPGIGGAGTRRPSSWAAMATGGSPLPSYPCSVLVHCLQGISRSGSVAVAYSMLYSRACNVPATDAVLNGDGGDLLPHQRVFFSALEAVQKGRPFVDPNAAFRSELMQIAQLWTDAAPNTSPQ